MDKIFGITAAKELFAFNLMPPKTKPEVDAELQKKRTNLYGILLPVLTVIVALFLSLINAVLIQPTLTGWKEQVVRAEAELNDPNSTLGNLKATNGEVVIKTEFVADPVSRNINFDRIFEIRDAVFDNNTTGSIATSYARESSGTFIVNALSTLPNGPQEILGRFREQGQVQSDSVQLRQVTYDTISREYRFSISFIILPDIGQTDGQS